MHTEVPLNHAVNSELFHELVEKKDAEAGYQLLIFVAVVIKGTLFILIFQQWTSLQKRHDVYLLNTDS